MFFALRVLGKRRDRAVVCRGLLSFGQGRVPESQQVTEPLLSLLQGTGIWGDLDWPVLREELRSQNLSPAPRSLCQAWGWDC